MQFFWDLRGSREGPKTKIQACIGCNYIALSSSTEYPDQARTRAVNQNVYVIPECKITGKVKTLYNFVLEQKTQLLSFHHFSFTKNIKYSVFYQDETSSCNLMVVLSNILYYYMANPALGKSLCSDWFFLGQDFAVRTVSMETVESVYFCFEAKPANSTFATKTAKKKCENCHSSH